MRVLWIVNIMPPSLAEHFNKKGSVSGGWIVGLLNDIKRQSDIELSVCVSCDNVEEYQTVYVDGVRYIMYKETGDDVVCFEKILNEIKPDIVHVWGTEYKHSLDMLNAARNLSLEDRTVVNIQGLTSIYGKYHYFAHLPAEVTHSNRLVEIRYGHRVKDERNELISKSKTEVETLQLTKHVIGRTDWDRACTTQINPKITYHFCNATLRDSFYKQKWSLSKCEKHSIFISQSYWPIKGLHMALEALAIVKKTYSDAKLYVIGESPLTWYQSKHYAARQRSYPRYLAKLICDNNLEDSIIFLPQLNEEEMCNRFLKSNVFISPSSIENESNSVGEAMLLGMPVVSSYVGGISNYMIHNEEGYFYQADAPYMLAYYICKVFEDENRAVAMGQRAREHARLSFNRETNYKAMLSIYQNIILNAKRG